MAGGKKRRANKKKKAQQTQQSSSHEHDDLRQHEEKDSDGGDAEALSPASLGAHGDPFSNDGAEEPKDHLPVVSHAMTESKSSEMDPVGLVGAPKRRGFEENENIEIVKELNSEDVSEGKTIDIECVDAEAVEMVANGSEEKENGVSLDNGSHIVEEKMLEKEEEEAAALEEASSQPEDMVKQIDSLPEEPAQVVGNTLVVDFAEPVPSMPNTKKFIHVTEALAEVSPAGSASALKDEYEKVRPVIDKAPEVSETVPEFLSPKFTETAGDMTDEIAGKSSSDEKERKLLVSPSTDVVTDENAVKPSTDEKEGKLLERPEAPVARARDVETAKESERSQPSENETPVALAPAPRISEKASWFSCCGIFDVITGSTR